MLGGLAARQQQQATGASGSLGSLLLLDSQQQQQQLAERLCSGEQCSSSSSSTYATTTTTTTDSSSSSSTARPARIPWTPTLLLDKRKSYQKRMRHLITVRVEWSVFCWAMSGRRCARRSSLRSYAAAPPKKTPP